MAKKRVTIVPATPFSDEVYIEVDVPDSASGVIDAANTVMNPLGSIPGYHDFMNHLNQQTGLNFTTGQGRNLGQNISDLAGSIGNTVTHGVSEFVGELNGSNKARKSQMDAQDAINAQKVADAKQLADEAKRKGELDTQASTTAGLLRQQAAQQQRNSLGFGSNDPSKDFLGL